MAQASKSDQTEDFLNSEVVSDDFFISIVENKLNISRDSFKLKLVLLFPAAGKNENFTSVLFRSKIKIEHNDGRKETVQAIVKALLEMMPELMEFGVFPRERKMYEHVIRSFQKIWEEVGVEVNFGPKSIKFETNPYEILVLDDLAENGYVMADRKVGVDLKVAKLFLKKLAMFHAASAVRFEKDGMVFKELNRDSLKMPQVPEGQPNLILDSFTNMIKAFHNAVVSWGEDFDVYADKIKKWNPMKLYNAHYDAHEPMKCGFQVLNHGDCWVNNFMIKYDEEKNPMDVLLIDFQVCLWASPAIDLQYFFLTSLQEDIKVDHFDELIEHYHTELVFNLKLLKYQKPIPSLNELFIDLLAKGNFGAKCLIIILFVCKLDSDNEISQDKIFEGGEGADELFKMVYQNENYAAACKKWLPFLNSRGFLECLL